MYIVSKTRKNGRGSATKGWKMKKPRYHQKTPDTKTGIFISPAINYPY